MTDSIMSELASRYRVNQENLLELVDGLTEEQIAWTPNETTPSVGVHVWHLARWADYFQELINGRGSQLWDIEGLAARWNNGILFQWTRFYRGGLEKWEKQEHQLNA